MESPPKLALGVLQTMLSLVAWSAIARLFVAPKLASMDRTRALAWLALPQMFRHVGVSQLVPGLVDESMPREFAVPTAIGDVVTQLLAVTTFVLLRKKPPLGVGAAWVLTVVGLLDLLHNVAQGARLGVATHMLAAWFIPTFGLPLMFVAHVMMIARLLRPEERGTSG